MLSLYDYDWDSTTTVEERRTARVERDLSLHDGDLGGKRREDEE